MTTQEVIQSHEKSHIHFYLFIYFTQNHTIFCHNMCAVKTIDSLYPLPIKFACSLETAFSLYLSLEYHFSPLI